MGDAAARFEFKVDDSYVRTSWKRERQRSAWVSTSFAIRILGIGVVWGIATLAFRPRWSCFARDQPTGARPRAFSGSRMSRSVVCSLLHRAVKRALRNIENVGIRQTETTQSMRAMTR